MDSDDNDDSVGKWTVKIAEPAEHAQYSVESGVDFGKPIHVTEADMKAFEEVLRNQILSGSLANSVEVVKKKPAPTAATQNYHTYNFNYFMKRAEIDPSPLLAGVCTMPGLRPAPLGPWLAGGALTRLLAGEDPLKGDIDLYFKNNDDFNKFKESLTFCAPNVRVVKENTAVLTLEAGPVTYQLIHHSPKNSPVEVIQEFDLTVCQVAYDGSSLIVGEHTLWDISRKMLLINKVNHGPSVIERIIRYASRGYKIGKYTLEDVCKTVAECTQDEKNKSGSGDKVETNTMVTIT